VGEWTIIPYSGKYGKVKKGYLLANDNQNITLTSIIPDRQSALRAVALFHSHIGDEKGIREQQQREKESLLNRQEPSRESWDAVARTRDANAVLTLYLGEATIKRDEPHPAPIPLKQAFIGVAGGWTF
jgi:hypothetical protein